MNSAVAAVPGSAVLAHNDPLVPVSNVGLTVDGNNRYVIVETADYAGELTALDFVKAPIGLGFTSYYGAGMSAVGGIYPSIVATTNYVYATKKLAMSPLTSPPTGKIDIVRATRSSMSVLLATGGISTGVYPHGRAHLDTINLLGGQQWVCFTDKTTSTTDLDDTVMRTTVGVPWSSGPNASVGIGAGPQDHCQTVTDSSSNQWIVYDDSVLVANVPTEGIRVKTGSTSFTAGGTLRGSAGTATATWNFPTIATVPTLPVREVVAERNGLIQLWWCNGTPTFCSASVGGDLSNWTSVGTTPATGAGSMGYQAKDPKLVLVARGEAWDRFLLVQRNGSVPKVHLWKWCRGGNKWLDVGEMPTPSDNAAIPDFWHTASELGSDSYPSSGMGLFLAAGNDLHATYIACHQDAACANQAAAKDAVVWTAPADDPALCP